MSGMARVLLDVAAERTRQQDDLGHDAEHDDKLGAAEWAWLIQRRAVDLSHPWDDAHVNRRQELVQIAAIAVAAIESIDRQEPS